MIMMMMMMMILMITVMMRINTHRCVSDKQSMMTMSRIKMMLAMIMRIIYGLDSMKLKFALTANQFRRTDIFPLKEGAILQRTVIGAQIHHQLVK